MHSTTKHFKLILAGLLAGVLAACGSNTTSTSEAGIKAAQLAPVTLAVDAYRPPANTTAPESPMKSRDLSAAPVATNIALGAPQESLSSVAHKYNERRAEDSMGKPLQIGFGREVAQTATTAATNQVLKWQATKSGGQVAAINFTSTGAKGLRIGLLVTQLPESATLRFYDKGAETAFEVKGSEVLKVLAKNLAAGDKTNEGRTYWGPVIDGGDGTIEIEIPNGVQTNGVDVSVPTVTHLFMSSKESSTAIAQITYSGDANAGLICQVDVKCEAALPASSEAVAHLRFNKSGSTYICSGTMLNNSLNDSTPYLLTANHCISDQTVASTLQTWFKYRSLICNNGSTGEYFPTATTGAALLYTAYGTDSTLMLLNGTPSVAGILYAGWDASAPATSTTTHGLHHPRGDQQRISRGPITGYSIRDASNPNLFFSSNITNGTILDVTFNTGLVEGGSSGSGLFKGTDTNPQLIGQLFGGLAGVCTSNATNSPQSTVYGRFDVAYFAGMNVWLAPSGLKSVSQFYNPLTGAYYYASGVTDANGFTNSNPGYESQSPSFKVSSVQTAGLSPVYRFYNTTNDTYFYTISEKERAAVASNTPRMRYDGIVWYASATLATNTTALYRAFNTTTGSHYFTISSATLSSFIAANPQYKADGIAYYVTTL